MKKIFVTRPIPESGIKYLKKQKGFKVIVRKKDTPIGRAELLKSVRGMDAILSILTDKIDEQVFLAAGDKLKIVANYAVGFNNLDLEAAKKHNVVLTNTPTPEITETVAEHTFALIMGLAHRIVEADKFTRAGKYHAWGPQLLLGTDVHDKTLGVIGMGRIGSEVAQRSVKGFGMKLIYNSKKRIPKIDKKYNAKFMSLKNVLKNSDFVTLHVPLLPSTKHMISSKQLRWMKKTAFLINTSRGPVIKEIALLKALKHGTIKGAGLDVYECEPMIDCNPKDNLELRKMDNVIITPHTASATIEARESMSLTAGKNIAAVLNGKKPLNPVFVN